MKIRDYRSLLLVLFIDKIIIFALHAYVIFYDLVIYVLILFNFNLQCSSCYHEGLILGDFCSRDIIHNTKGNVEVTGQQVLSGEFLCF